MSLLQEKNGTKRICDTELCLGDYQFATEFGENSVVTEWGLICEKRYLTLLGPTVYYVGVLMGAWIAGLLADRIGRLPVQAICLYTQGTMAVALYVVQVRNPYRFHIKVRDCKSSFY